VTLEGEVDHAGVYGITEGERLSTILKRAGGLRASAYPEGAVLERIQVRQLGEKARSDLIKRIQSEDLVSMTTSNSSTPQERQQVLQTMRQQQQQALTALRDQPASGRLVVTISSDISRWENTQVDVELRNGDVVTIPKKAAFVVVSGQVYSPSALSYVPGKNAGWYLNHAGGPTTMANRKDIFIVRANGSVIGRRRGLFGESILSIHLRPGDSVVVPEKLLALLCGRICSKWRRLCRPPLSLQHWPQSY
jgi:polysaccharide biosynthesis/export protein